MTCPTSITGHRLVIFGAGGLQLRKEALFGTPLSSPLTKHETHPMFPTSIILVTNMSTHLLLTYAINLVFAINMSSDQAAAHVLGTHDCAKVRSSYCRSASEMFRTSRAKSRGSDMFRERFMISLKS